MKIKAILPVFAVIAALAFALSMSAFQTKKSPGLPPPSVSDVWYSFSGTPSDYGTASYYTRVTGTPPGNCGGEEVLCAIKLPQNGMSPNPNPAHLNPTAIAALVDDGVENDQVKIRDNE